MYLEETDFDWVRDPGLISSVSVGNGHANLVIWLVVWLNTFALVAIFWEEGNASRRRLRERPDDAIWDENRGILVKVFVGECWVSSAISATVDLDHGEFQWVVGHENYGSHLVVVGWIWSRDILVVSQCTSRLWFRISALSSTLPCGINFVFPGNVVAPCSINGIAKAELDSDSSATFPWAHLPVKIVGICRIVP